MIFIFPITGEMLDALVLSVLNNGDTYGYEIIQLLKDELEISESTLYPVLRRLQKNDFLETYDQPFNGRNRRYYKITNSGIIQLGLYKVDWIEYKKKLGKIMEGKINE